mmetsp:Transcript_108627/g.171416  ORF Transcript_108627/g.171416 Transcript_108627/m.171416 type:complete len:347 (-) Transcript_108627:2164-3204(-)
MNIFCTWEHAGLLADDNRKVCLLQRLRIASNSVSIAANDSASPTTSSTLKADRWCPSRSWQNGLVTRRGLSKDLDLFSLPDIAGILILLPKLVGTSCNASCNLQLDDEDGCACWLHRSQIRANSASSAYSDSSASRKSSTLKTTSGECVRLLNDFREELSSRERPNENSAESPTPCGGKGSLVKVSLVKGSLASPTSIPGASGSGAFMRKDCGLLETAGGPGKISELLIEAARWRLCCDPTIAVYASSIAFCTSSAPTASSALKTTCSEFVRLLLKDRRGVDVPDRGLLVGVGVRAVGNSLSFALVGARPRRGPDWSKRSGACTTSQAFSNAFFSASGNSSATTPA